MSRPSFPACAAHYPPFKYGRLIYPQTAIRAGIAKFWSTEAFQEFLLFQKCEKAVQKNMLVFS